MSGSRSLEAFYDGSGFGVGFWILGFRAFAVSLEFYRNAKNTHLHR